MQTGLRWIKGDQKRLNFIMNPRLSIVTVCYNSAPLLEETIRSVLKQKDVSTEYLVIDGASADGTPTILDKYGQHIDVIVSETDRGIFDAMNKGIKLARGDFILFVNAGDRLCDNALTGILPRLLPDRDVYYCNYYETAVVGGRELMFEGARCFNLSHEMPTSHNAMIFSQKSFDKYGVYNTGCKFSADYEWLCRNNKNLKSSAIDVTLIFSLLGGLTDRNSFSVIMEKSMIAKKYFGWSAFAWHLIRIVRVFPVYMLKRLLIKIGIFDRYLIRKHSLKGMK